MLLLGDCLGGVLGGQLQVRGDVAAEAVAGRAGATGARWAGVGNTAEETDQGSIEERSHLPTPAACKLGDPAKLGRALGHWVAMEQAIIGAGRIYWQSGRISSEF